RDGLEIVYDVVLQGIDGRIGDMRIPDAEHNGVSIWCGTGDPSGSNAPGPAANILHNDALAERGPHPLGDDAADNIREPARGEWHNQGDGTRRISLSDRHPWRAVHGGSAGRELYKSSAGKIHVLFRHCLGCLIDDLFRGRVKVGDDLLDAAGAEWIDLHAL